MAHGGHVDDFFGFAVAGPIAGLVPTLRQFGK